jgi:hypothetical protein
MNSFLLGSAALFVFAIQEQAANENLCDLYLIQYKSCNEQFAANPPNNLVGRLREISLREHLECKCLTQIRKVSVGATNSQQMDRLISALQDGIRDRSQAEIVDAIRQAAPADPIANRFYERHIK